MKIYHNIQKIGLFVFLIGLGIFTASSFFGEYKLTHEIANKTFSELQLGNIGDQLSSEIIGKEYTAPSVLALDIINIYDSKNEEFIDDENWDQVMWENSADLAFKAVKASDMSVFKRSPWLMFFLTFGLGILGGLMIILPSVITLGPAGIKNNGIFQSASTNRGWIGYATFIYLVTFYVVLYFYPYWLVNQVSIVNPVSLALSGNSAGKWFLYGFMYCTIMVVMGIRMYIKYRHNKYQIIRTTSVLFFQIAFAFLIPQILVRFNMPYMDFKNAWPLDYTFFFDWHLDSLIESGNIGIFMLVWGIVLTVVIVPIMVYFYGKRWYCSWVCGCGGLAETLGDPYRQLSDKSIASWKLERWLIHGVLVFAIVMTGGALYTYFSGVKELFGIETYSIQKTYGFLIGSIFSGVIGTGFYPVFGNRTWCRFGCPLAAYMGIVQRFKSRFRITTNGGQCISCGNCSTYCEQGIDVRAYAQKGQNIVRASCVGCGVCSAVCPRGVLKLENGPEEGRITDNPIIIGSEGISVKTE